MSNTGFKYKCRRCGCFFWVDSYEAKALRNTDHRMPSPMIAPLTEIHECDPLECENVVGMGIADLIGYEATP